MSLWFKEVLMGTFVLVASLVAAGAVSYFVRLLRSRVSQKRVSSLGEELLVAGRWPIYCLVLVCGLVIVLNREVLFKEERTV